MLQLTVISQILKLSIKVFHSPQIREELASLSADAGLHSEVLIRTVKTRWNTVHDALERAIDMQDVLGELCDKAQFNKRSGARLRRFIVTDEEWQLIDQLYRLLDVRFRISLVSTSRTHSPLTALRLCDPADIVEHTGPRLRNHSVHGHPY